MSKKVMEKGEKDLAVAKLKAIPKGYKQTELGVIPEDWEVVTLAQSTNCLDNLRIPLNEKQRSKMIGNIPYCGANGIVDWVNDYVIDDDIILMAEDGGYFDEYTTRPIAYRIVGKCWINNHVHILQTKDNFDQVYVFYNLVHKDIQKYLASGTRAKLNKSEMERIEIVIPTLKQEQIAIANVLSDVDLLIYELEKLLSKKQNIKTATMQQLLTGRTRLPQFALRKDGTKKGYKASDLGEIPEDWDSVSLGDMAKINMGQSPSSLNYNNNGIGLPLVQGNADIRNRKTIVRNYTTEITKIAEKGDLILSVRAPVGEVAIADFICCIGRGVCAIKYFNDYLYHWLVAFETKWDAFSKGSTFDSINSNELKEIKFVKPLLEEQTAIATILSDMDSEIQTLEQRLNKTRQIKQGMMQELLTGKTRLPLKRVKGV